MIKQYPQSRYVSGTYKRECDGCGFDFLRIELRIQWNGLKVCEKCFELKPREAKPFPAPNFVNIRID